MGFLKRFFSLGSKKSRRKHQARQAEHVDASGRVVVEVAEQADGEATRLLRSASANFAVLQQVDYSLLPPMPYPVGSAPIAPVASAPKSAASVQRRGTYTVKVLERKIESCTEFPNANPSLPDVNAQLDISPARPRVNPAQVPCTPRDQSRLLRLRQDPSVASLLNMYDDNGRISSTAFSNTPPTPAMTQDVGGRAQVQRSGSTLRQLLGDKHDSEKDDAAEGDISWAERFLGEHAGSSSSLVTTNLAETHIDTHLIDNHSSTSANKNIALSSDHSRDLSNNHPTISSMEVELSNTTETNVNSSSSRTSATQEPAKQKTPMRATEVFGFLTERRRSILERQRSQSERTISRTNSETLPRQEDIPPPVPPKPDILDSSDTSMLSPAQIHTATVTKLTPIANPLSRSTDTLNLLYSQHTGPIPSARCESALSIRSTESQSSSTTLPPSKIPRGPRPLPTVPQGSRARQPLYIPTDARERSGKLHGGGELAATIENLVPRSRVPKHSQTPTNTPVRPRHQRRTSGATNNNDGSQRTSASKKSRRPERVHRDKENTPPPPPLRTIFDVRHPHLVKGEPPSPASSSELSPYTKEIMMHLRKQRMRTRDEVRQTSLGRASRRRA